MLALSLKYLISNRMGLVFNPPLHSEEGDGGMFPVGKQVDGDRAIIWRGGKSSNCKQQFGGVIWILHGISLWRTGSMDAISFDFGGCIMALYDFGDSDWHAAHIHMGDPPSRYTDWSAYVKRNPRINRLVMFRPDDMVYETVLDRYQAEGGKEHGLQIAGLITHDEKKCYTLYLVNLDRNDVRFRLLAYKEHTVPTRKEAYGRILDSTNKEVWDAFFDGYNNGELCYLDDDVDIPRRELGVVLGNSEVEGGGSCCY